MLMRGIIDKKIIFSNLVIDHKSTIWKFNEIIWKAKRKLFIQLKNELSLKADFFLGLWWNVNFTSLWMICKHGTL